jgi:hypothetical protein
MGKLETQQHWAQKEDKQNKTHHTKTKQMSEQHCSIYHNQYMESQNQNYITIQ